MNKVDMNKYARHAVVALGLAAVSFGVVPSQSLADAPKKYNIFVTVGFDGNTWMEAAQNLIRAISKTKNYKDRVAELTIQSARGDAQTQAQQINAAVEGGADIIIAWPNSPTALNRSVRNACQRGVTVVTFDAQVTEPCAYHVGIDQCTPAPPPPNGLPIR